MKIKLFTILISLLSIFACSKSSDATDDPATPAPADSLQGPIQRPVSGYGADGPYKVAEIDFPNTEYAGTNVSIFYPQNITSPRPVIFYSHPFGGEDKMYNTRLYHFLAQKGYVVVFVPYATNDVSVEHRYTTLWNGFKGAVARYPDLIDTRKVGFMGHSFGGGASFALAYKGFVEEGWGQDGRFIFVEAPWYSYEITEQQIQNFPSNTKLISQVYDDDVINDHRMAIDLFKRINIPNSEKDYMLVKKSIIRGYTYTAEHNLPSTRIGTAYDAYDYYAVYRLLDALIDYSFNGNAAGKNVALGNGSAEQVTMPGYNGDTMFPLEVTDNPVPKYPQSRYQFPYESWQNPRKGYSQWPGW